MGLVGAAAGGGGVTAGPPRSEAFDSEHWRAFILANTRVLSPPLVPEIRLHLAEETLAIWQKTEDELHALNVPPPFWAFAWAGGQALARYVLDNRHVVTARRVVDIGAGSGIGAIAAARTGASAVLATDIDAIACVAVEENARLNGVWVKTSARDVLAEPIQEAAAPEIVLIGDLFYAREIAEQAMTFLERVTVHGATVLVGDPKRSYFPADRFEAVATYKVVVSRELEDSEIRLSSVWRLRQR